MERSGNWSDAPSCNNCVQNAQRAAVEVEMNIGERFARLVKSNVNQLISNMEDPEKALMQTDAMLRLAAI